VYQFATVNILHYAGNGQWSHEEDVYNATEAEQVLTTYVEAAARAGVQVPAGPQR